MVQYFDYEITLRYAGEGKIPGYLKKERGIDKNKPVIIAAPNERNARKQLILPKALKIKSIHKKGCPTGKQYNIPKKKCMEKKR